MKNNKNKLSAIEQFQKDLAITLERFYRKALSDNAKRSWQKRRMLSAIKKVAM